MELFRRIVIVLKPLTIFPKRSIFDVCQGSKCTFDNTFVTIREEVWENRFHSLSVLFFQWYLSAGMRCKSENILTNYHNRQKVPNLPILWSPPPSYIACLPFSNFVEPPSLSPLTFNPTALLVILFLWLSGCLCHVWYVILLNDIMGLHMSSLG